MEEEKQPIQEEGTAEQAGIDVRRADWKLLYEMFGAKEGRGETDRQLEKIWKFAEARAGSKDHDAVMAEIRHLNGRLGSASWTDKPWTKLVNYVSTWDQLNRSNAS